MSNPHLPIQISNLRAIAWHLEKGEDNGGIPKEALALQLRSVADNLEHLLSLLDSADKMRAAQKEYFRTRSKESLIDSKALEKIVDGFIHLTKGA